MTKTENRFKHEGVWYVAVEQDECRNCAFYGGDKQCSAPIPEVNLVPRCGSLRADGRNVIFVESDADNQGGEE